MGVIEAGEALNAVLPEQFGKYSLIGHLATGGMAEVWLARQIGLQGFEKIVVIKRARPDLTDRDTTRRFLEEARLVATLEHPNIAQVYEIGAVGGSYFFVMEYVDGADLRRLIEAAIAKRQRISLADALYIIIHVCTGLHYAHEKHDLDGHPLQIVHRDVSPSNVLISYDGTIKVCDFGVAKAHHPKGDSTQDGVVKGKFSYMSPEQTQSRPIDRRSDVFSIGVLLYELTTLTKLFRARGDYALLQQVAEAKIPLPSSRVPGYPLELEQVVVKALARDPDERYPTAQALQLDLEELAREHKLVMSSTRITKLMSSLVERRKDIKLRVRGSRSDLHPGMEITPTTGSGGPAFVASGSAPSAPGMEGVTGGRSVSASVPTHRSAALWLVGAVLAGGVAVAVSVADRMIGRAEDRSAASALAGDVERLASVFDSAARSAHMRADGIATTPMLRAAIETDAATLRDMASSEMVFTAGKGEALEVYQFSKGKPVSLLRIPKDGPALMPLKGRATQIASDGRSVTLLASAPISGYRAGQSGGIVISTPVDVAPVQRTLDEHCVAASLTGLGNELVLVGSGGGDDGSAGGGGAPVKLAVPASGDWTGGATLNATPRPGAGLPWARPVRYLSGGLAGLLLLGFGIALVRRPRT